MNKLKDSELILTSSERIYHLNLKDEEVSDNIILVGAPERVNQISQKFDTIEFQIQHREFVTHTGTFNNKKITISSDIKNNYLIINKYLNILYLIIS